MKAKGAALLAVIVILGCASTKVTTRFEPGTKFDAYRTFHFVAPQDQSGSPATGRKAFFSREVMREIRPMLESKGFAETGSADQADLLVHFYAVIKNQRDFVPPAYRVGRWGRAHVVRPGHAVRYKEGTLVIDIVDRARQDLVWQGIGRGVLDRKEPAKNLIESVEKILEDFPPAP
ncbi:DUF4136 domain-containing protein [bacterium]|nr:DUF4136 domain-containing protein [bacterium]